MAVLILPLIVPVIITEVGTYLFYAPVWLANSFLGIIIAQTTLDSPFVIVTVGASLANFDRTLMRAATISSARPLVAFQRVILPLIPGGRRGAGDDTRSPGSGAISDDDETEQILGPAWAGTDRVADVRAA
jgi:putative spermidine/putrescine transport system permease protein